ncbi:alpha/beta hydrolase [Priestia abyssalis]|uniref:alpha/beta hydrolase n=1 Tax=Priestia abyssalis TaxID=1221450 RepID=UPI00111730D3|nr:alpha/beta hydrolase [Priestia abyssalis]
MIKTIIWIICIVACLAIIVFFYKEPIMRAGSVKQQPTLMIHGFRGTERSMASMIKRFESNGWGTHVQTCIVNYKGTLQWSSAKKAKNGSIPLIHVVFKNNTASLQQQGEWVAQIAAVTGKHYKTTEINVIAHSMGGLAALKYITDYSSSAYPKVEKLVTLGTPAAGLDMKDLVKQYPNAKTDEGTPASIDLQAGSSALKDLHVKFGHLNKYDVYIFSIAGNSEKMRQTKGDGSVTENSALFLSGFSDKVKTASFPVSHFDLHESAEVDHAVYEFVSEKK